MENAEDSFAKERSNGENRQFILDFFRRNRKRIGNNQFLDVGILDSFGSRICQYRMADCSIYAFSAIFGKSFGTFAEGSCCINDIINNEAVSVFLRCR